MCGLTNPQGAAKPQLMIFASGGPEPEDGGSGFLEMALHQGIGNLPVEIVAVVSQYPDGGVKTKAEKLGIPFICTQPKKANDYLEIWQDYDNPWVALSGWIFKVYGIPSPRIINVHPAPLPQFGGQGWYGLTVHERVLEAFKKGEIDSSAVCPHFVDTDDNPNVETYDSGPVFFRVRVPILEDDTPKTLQQRVGNYEHALQWWATLQVVIGEIFLDKHGCVNVPKWYLGTGFCPFEQLSPQGKITIYK